MKRPPLIIIISIIILAVIYIINIGSRYSFNAEIDGVPVKGSRSFAEYSNGQLIIYTLLKDPVRKGIIIYVNASAPGKYLLDSQEGANYQKGNHGQYHVGEKQNMTNFLSVGTHPGKCELTKFDLGNNTVSGKFEFDTYQLTTSGIWNRVIHITNGSFENIPVRKN